MGVGSINSGGDGKRPLALHHDDDCHPGNGRDGDGAGAGPAGEQRIGRGDEIDCLTGSRS